MASLFLFSKLIYLNWQFAYDTLPFIKKKPAINSLYLFKTVIRLVNKSFIAFKRICGEGMTPVPLHFTVLFTISLNLHITSIKAVPYCPQKVVLNSWVSLH